MPLSTFRCFTITDKSSTQTLFRYVSLLLGLAAVRCKASRIPAPLPLWSTSSDFSAERGIRPHTLGLNHATESFSLSDRGGASPHCAFTNPFPSPAKHSACGLIWACSFCSSRLRSYHESGWGLWLWGLLLFILEIPGIGNISKDVLFVQLWLQQLECLNQMTSLDAGV